jgi:hypothetical protein
MKGLSILHRQLVQTEALADFAEFLGTRLEEPEPYEPTLAAPCGRVFERELALVLATTVLVVRAVDDHGGLQEGFGQRS